MNVESKLCSDGIGRVRFSCPPHNHLSVEGMRSISDALQELGSDQDCRVILLSSEGRVFCAGADFTTENSMASGEGDAIRSFYEQAARSFECPVPVIVLVQGACVGAGLGLALAAEFRIAATAASFSANFVKLGFHPGFALTLTLPHLVGRQNALKLALAGGRIKASEALAYGLVDQVVPDGDLKPAAVQMAHQFAQNAPLAMRATLKTLKGGLVAEVRAQMELELQEQDWLRLTSDFKEGVQAVSERRIGNFVGR